MPVKTAAHNVFTAGSCENSTQKDSFCKTFDPDHPFTPD